MYKLAHVFYAYNLLNLSFAVLQGRISGLQAYTEMRRPCLPACQGMQMRIGHQKMLEPKNTSKYV